MKTTNKKNYSVILTSFPLNERNSSEAIKKATEGINKRASVFAVRGQDGFVVVISFNKNIKATDKQEADTIARGNSKIPFIAEVFENN